MRELLESIDRVLGRLAQGAPPRESLEWYLANNLGSYRDALLSAKTRIDVENATRALSRFCTESMEWDSDLFRECTRIQEEGFALAKSWPVG
jgi:hypothetical protein